MNWYTLVKIIAITIILSIIIVACVVVYFILTAIYPYAG